MSMEPGQFAVRGSIIDVYSFSSELPYRVDFFGDDIETIRTFEVESQLSNEKLKRIEIVQSLQHSLKRRFRFSISYPMMRYWHSKTSSMFVTP